MSLQIRKKSTSAWEHIKGGQNIQLSKGSFRLENAQFELTEISGVDQFFEPRTPIADITIYDDTDASLPEVYTNTTDFVNRLRELGYPFFSTALGGSSAGASFDVEVNQTAHGFSVGDVIQHNGTSYVAANSATAADADAIGIVTTVTDVDNFTYTYGGLIATNLGLSNGDSGFLQDDGSVANTEGTINLYLGTQTPEGFLIEIGQGFEVDPSNNSSASVTEITDNVITFTTLKSWANTTLSSLTVDLTDAIEGARTVCQFLSDENPNFGEDNDNIDFVSGAWVSGTPLLLEFEYFQSKVYLVISQLEEAIDPVLLSGYDLYLDNKDLTSLTIDANNLVSAFNDQSASNNDFSASGSERPLLKRSGLYFDGSANILKRTANITSFNGDTNGELFIVFAKRDDDFKILFSLQDNTDADNYLTIQTGNEFNAGYEGALFVRDQINSGTTNRVAESRTYEKNENLTYQIYSVISTGYTYKITKNGEFVDKIITNGVDSGTWFGGKNISDGVYAFGGRTGTSTKQDIASVIYYPFTLTPTQRRQAVKFLNNRLFGMETPIHTEDQTLSPVFAYTNNRYNWTGAQDKSPTTNNILSIYDRGNDHYPVDDYHDIMGQLSTDNGETYGNEFAVTLNTGVLSYTNPSLGYSSTGRAHCIYSEVDFAGGTYNTKAFRFKYSDDDGATWSNEGTVTGLIYIGINSTAFGNTNTTIIEGEDGNLYCTFNESTARTSTASIRVGVLRSTDNGLTWAVYGVIDSNTNQQNDAINEASLTQIGTDTWVTVVRVQSQNYYNQYISTDNCLTWTKQGENSFCDWWTDETIGISSLSVHLPRTAKFNIDGVDVIALIYLNRGVNANLSVPTYYRIVVARCQDIIDYGINGWQDGCAITLRVKDLDLKNIDGYADIKFFDNDNLAYIRAFYDTTDEGTARNFTDIQYFKYRLNENWIKAVLNI